jgi:hypothetical protein
MLAAVAKVSDPFHGAIGHVLPPMTSSNNGGSGCLTPLTYFRCSLLHYDLTLILLGVISFYTLQEIISF